MKPVILAISLLLNLGLAFHLWQSAGTGGEAPTLSLRVREVPRGDLSVAPNPAADSPATPPEAAVKISVETLSAMPTKELLERLRAAGFSETLVRAIITVQLDALVTARMQDMQRMALDRIPYWQALPMGNALTAAQTEELDGIRRENAKRIRELLGAPPAGGLDVMTNQVRYGDLPAEKIERLKTIDADYNSMTASLRGIPTAAISSETQEKLRLLETEKDRDIRNVLTANEYDDYFYRTSPTSGALRSSLRGFAPTEAEFRALFAVQSAFDRQYPVPQVMDMAAMRARSEAQAQLQTDLRAVLSPDRQAEFEKATKK